MLLYKVKFSIFYAKRITCTGIGKIIENLLNSKIMEVLQRNSIYVECPLCKSILKVSPDDIFKSMMNYGCIKCPVCCKNTWIYDATGRINENVRIKIVKE